MLNDAWELQSGSTTETEICVVGSGPAGLTVTAGHDLVGRCLMDHPLVDGGDVVPASADLLDSMALYDLRAVDGRPAMAHLRRARPALLPHGLLQLSAMLFPRERDHRTRYRLTPRQGRAHRAFFDFRINRRSAGLGDWARLPRILLGADGLWRLAMRDRNGRYPRLGRGGWSRMPRPSAVFDVDCRLHAAPNVFIASSSTFVTGGFANPTLTVVALALRIADRLRSTLRPGILAPGTAAAALYRQPERVPELPLSSPSGPR